MPPRKTRAQAAAEKAALDAENDRKALELRKAGASLEAIAAALDLEPGVVAASLARSLAGLTQESDEDLRRLEIERLDALQRALWPKALKGEGASVDRCLAIMERRARLLKLDRERKPEEATDGIDQLAAKRAARRSEAARLSRT